MRRRNFMLAGVAASGWILGGCAAGGGAVTPAAREKRRRAIDAGYFAVLERVQRIAPDLRELANRASGVLVFPTIVVSDINLAELSGEGVLHIADAMAGYYRMSASPLPAPRDATRSLAILFRTFDALDDFRSSEVWTAGEHAPLPIAQVRPDGSLAPGAGQSGILAFGLDASGVIANPVPDRLRIMRLDL